MNNQQKIYEVSITDIQDDLTRITGDRTLAKAHAESLSIYYRGEIIDSVKYKEGIIPQSDFLLSRRVRWEHMKMHSTKLAENMSAANRGKKPENTAAHHIVSWSDMRAARARLRLAAFGIDIDHEANGVYLPRFQKHAPMDSMPDAYPHSKIHSGKYYLNIDYLLEDTIADGLGHRGIIETLRYVAEDLKNGVFPINSSLTAAG